MSDSKWREELAEVLKGRMSPGTSGRWIAEYGETPGTLADALLPVLARMKREWQAEALREAADDLDRFARETYGEDIFRRPTAEDYAEINALLKRERGHQLDGIAADVMSRATEVQAARLRDRAEASGREGERHG